MGVLLTLLWGTIFYWDTIGTKWPLLRLGIEVVLALLILAVPMTLFGTIYYLLLIK